MTATYQITQAAELPTFTRTWLDADGKAVDLSGSTLSLRINVPDAPIEKTSGVSGDANGVVTIAWTSGELDSVPPGTYAAQVWARDGSGLDRVMDDLLIQVKKQIPTPA